MDAARHHMDRVRGLAPKSWAMGPRNVEWLLAERFDGIAVDIKAITPEHVRHFLAEQAALHSKPAGAGSVVSSLRGDFRHGASPGDWVHGLIGALACPADWAPSSQPRTLTDEEVAQFNLDDIDWHAGTITLRHTRVAMQPQRSHAPESCRPPRFHRGGR